MRKSAPERRLPHTAVPTAGSHERDLYRRLRVDPKSVEVRVWSADRLLETFSQI